MGRNTIASARRLLEQWPCLFCLLCAFCPQHLDPQRRKCSPRPIRLIKRYQPHHDKDATSQLWPARRCGGQSIGKGLLTVLAAPAAGLDIDGGPLAKAGMPLMIRSRLGKPTIPCFLQCGQCMVSLAASRRYGRRDPLRHPEQDRNHRVAVASMSLAYSQGNASIKAL